LHSACFRYLLEGFSHDDKQYTPQIDYMEDGNLAVLPELALIAAWDRESYSGLRGVFSGGQVVF
jgi:hypothetical protein